MIWMYRILAILMVGYGSYLVLGDLPPHTAFLSGIEFAIGLYFILLPGAANLLNGFIGRRFSIVRWGVVVINAGLIAFGVVESLEVGLEADTALIVAAFLVLLILSILLARSWAKASREAKEAG